MKSRKYKAFVIGAGKIGSGYDRPGSKETITHAHAITLNKDLDLAGIVDIDRTRAEREAKKWSTSAFFDIATALEATGAEIAVIASPDETHAEALSELLRRGFGQLKAIVMEKPVTLDRSTARRVRTLSSRSRIPVVVNYRRRFDPTIERLSADLISGRYGATLSARALYTKGILHNGSHMMDLARHLFGELIAATPHFEVDDFPGGTPTVGGVATFERCPEFHLMTGDERSFYVFELEIVTEKARIKMIDEVRMIEIEQVVKDPHYSDSRALGTAKRKRTELHLAMERMMKHVVLVAEGKTESHSSLENAIRTEEACRAFIKGARRTGRVGG